MKTTFLVLSVVAFGACGGKSPEQYCIETANIDCERSYACDSPAKIGNSVDDCKTTSKSLCQAAFALGGDGCTDGKKFSPANADACETQTNAASCDAFNQGQPAVCAQVCQ